MPGPILRRGSSSLAATFAVALVLSGAAMAKTVSVTARQSGHTVHVHTGDTLRITLAENPSTGYAWRYAVRPSRRILAQKSRRFTQSPAPQHRVGVGGKLTITFKVVGTGKTSLRLVYHAPGRSKKIAGRFRLTVSAS